MVSRLALKERSRAELRLNIRVNDKLVKLVDKAIAIGAAKDRSEFVRISILNRLEQLGVLKDSSTAAD